MVAVVCAPRPPRGCLARSSSLPEIRGSQSSSGSSSLHGDLVQNAPSLPSSGGKHGLRIPSYGQNPTCEPAPYPRKPATGGGHRRRPREEATGGGHWEYSKRRLSHKKSWPLRSLDHGLGIPSRNHSSARPSGAGSHVRLFRTNTQNTMTSTGKQYAKLLGYLTFFLPWQVFQSWCVFCSESIL